MKHRQSMNAMLTRVRLSIGALSVEPMLVGGCTPTQYALGPVDVRPTEDVDLVFPASKLHEWATLERELLALGFNRPLGDHSLARFEQDDLKIDVVTVPLDVAGSNRWYADAIRHRMRSDAGWWIPPPEDFLAMKFEAYNDPHREGHGEPIGSRDIEDIFILLRGIPTLIATIRGGSRDAHRFVRAELTKLITLPNARDVFDANCEQDEASRLRVQRLFDECFSAFGKGP